MLPAVYSLRYVIDMWLVHDRTLTRNHLNYSLRDLCLMFIFAKVWQSTVQGSAFRGVMHGNHRRCFPVHDCKMEQAYQDWNHLLGNTSSLWLLIVNNVKCRLKRNRIKWTAFYFVLFFTVFPLPKHIRCTTRPLTRRSGNDITWSSFQWRPQRHDKLGFHVSSNHFWHFFAMVW